MSGETAMNELEPSGHVTPNAAPQLERLPTRPTTLSITWLNGQFRALAVHKGVIEAVWKCPHEVEVSGFAKALQDAVAYTGYHGSTVSLVLAHPRLGHQLVESPPIKSTGVVRFLERQLQMVLYLGGPPPAPPALVRYVQRQVQSLKPFDGEAASCFEHTILSQGANRLLVHMFPKTLLNLLIQACAKTDLFLTAVVPAMAVLQSQLPLLPIKKDEIALLAGDTAGATEVVVGRKDGQILLSRTLSGSWNQDPSRFRVEIQRTILFVSQEFGLDVNGLWLFGPGAADHLAGLQSETGVTTQLSPVKYHDLYWARDSLLLLPETTPNLLSLEERQRPRQRLLLKLASWGALLLVSFAVATSLYLGVLMRRERGQFEHLQVQMAELQVRHKDLQALTQQLASKEELVKLVSDDRLPPVPGWLLGCLGEAVPPELLLTNVHVWRQENLWHLKLAGVLQPTTNAEPATLLSNAVVLFHQRLAAAPFNMKIASASDLAAHPAEPATPSAMAEWGPGLEARLGALSASRGEPATQFTVEGIMQ